MINRTKALLVSTLLAAIFPACPAASKSPPEAKPKTAILLRTYFVPLRADVEMGPNHPPLDRFTDSGRLPGGQAGKDQLRALQARYTLKTLAYQYSNVKPVEESGETVLELGFGEQVQVKVSDLKEMGSSTLTAKFTITFGPRQLYQRLLPFKRGDCLLFAGHLDVALPILSVFAVEIRSFPADAHAAYADFLEQARKDSVDFAPPPVQQRDAEPYLPGVGDVTMPELISRDRAVYPDAAKPERMEGQVIVEVVVDKEGKATRPRVITLPSIFDQSALQASTTYRYKPAMKNGQPVSVTMNIIIVFKYSVYPS